jgi:peroxiredoxin
MREDLGEGGTFPDLRLRDHDGNTRTLASLAEGDPLVLHFYRGWFCPKDRAYFRMLLALQDEAEVAYTRLVSVSVEPPEVTGAFRAGMDARWTFLCDTDRTYLDDLGLRETTDTLHDPYVPTVVTLFPDLRIHRTYNGYWYWGRATAEELRRDLRAITRELRPDWEPPA